MPQSTAWIQQLQQGTKQLSINLSSQQNDQLVHYLKQLDQWNQAYNLSGVKTISRMVTHHLLDSLAVLPYVTGKTVLDVGTGAGLPGIPLAIALQNKQFTLLDCTQKKTAFLRHIIFKLQIKNVSVVKKRLNCYQPEHCFDTIICRAFGRYDDFVGQTRHLCCEGGKLVAMKGTSQLAKQETMGLSADIHPLFVPGLAAKRHVIVMRR